MTREEAIKWLICVKEEVDESEGTMIYISKKQADALGMAIEALSESKVHNMHNGDLISRAEAIKTIHRYKYRLEGTGQTYGFLLEEFENRIPSAEAPKPTGDLISRADAIEAIDDVIDADSPQWAILRTKIGFLPSADAVQGEWIKTVDGNGWNDWWVFKCPICGATIEDKQYRSWGYNFCPNCGAMMLREDGEE